MSYARCSDDSDVYVYKTFDGFQIYLSNRVSPKCAGFRRKTVQDTIELLEKFKLTGVRVPERCLERLRKEAV